MPPYTELRDELENDPLGRGYAGMTDAEALESLLTPNRTIAKTVSVDAVRQYLITQINGTGNNQRSAIALVQEFAELGTVRGAAPTVTPTASLQARRSGCQMLWYMLGLADSTAFFPVTDANVVAQFVGIGPDGGTGPSVLTAAQLTAIGALAEQVVSRAEELGFPDLTAYLVGFSRSL